jgi:acyl-CoA thioesterase
VDNDGGGSVITGSFRIDGDAHAAAGIIVHVYSTMDLAVTGGCGFTLDSEWICGRGCQAQLVEAQEEQSRARAQELYQRDPTCQLLGITLEEAGTGRARVRMAVADSMVNGHGIAHGGFLFLLADAAFAFASNTHGPIALAQSAEVTFLRPVAAGESLLAEAVERTRSGLNGIYDVTVRRPDGTVIAEFRGHSVLITETQARRLLPTSLD